MNKSEVFEFIDRFERSGLTVFEYEDNGRRIHLEKKSGPNAVQQSEPLLTSPSDDSLGAHAKQDAPVKVSDGYGDQSAAAIKAPLVGVFYRAASPGAEPFAEIGSEIKKGGILCVIEAMKVMNEIKAPYDLKVRRILAADGDMIDCSRALFEVEKC